MSEERAFKERPCRACGKGVIRPLAIEGRTMDSKRAQEIEAAFYLGALRQIAKACRDLRRVHDRACATLPPVMAAFVEEIETQLDGLEL